MHDRQRIRTKLPNIIYYKSLFSEGVVRVISFLCFVRKLKDTTNNDIRIKWFGGRI